MDDATLIKKAEEFYSEERLLKAAELLKQVQDKENLFTDHHKMILIESDHGRIISLGRFSIESNHFI